MRLSQPVSLEALCVQETASCWIKNLMLQNFRGYDSFCLETDHRSVVLTGQNGAGKTNVLEALSLLMPGKGLRRAKPQDFVRRGSGSQNWSVSVTMNVHHEDVHVGTGVQSLTESADERRIVKINHAVSPQVGLSEWVSVFWQTPQMDRLFDEGMSVQRKFLDRLVITFFPEHAQHLYRYEHALRERSRLLKEGTSEIKWVEILEATLAQEAFAILSLRQVFLKELNPLCKVGITKFPSVELSLKGELENWAETMSSLDAEEKFQRSLQESRSYDAQFGGAKVGPHQTQVKVWHEAVGQFAELCSTGEQKALLLGILLANCRLHMGHHQRRPLLLLDEVVAHLDNVRRESLFEEIENLGIQAWFTGTDESVFLALGEKAQFFNIHRAKLMPKIVN